jgi:ribosomal protein S18 acetylase RimI-like enzyme
MMIVNVLLYFFLFRLCESLIFPRDIKNLFNAYKLPSISIDTYNKLNPTDVSSFITNERYKNLPNNLYNEMVGMINKDFLYRQKNSFSDLPFTILIASKDNKIVGVITIESCEIDINGKKENQPVISNLIVSSEMRRQGIAKLLTIRAEKLAKTLKYKHVYLFVDIDNIPALKLYKSRGYKSFGDKKKTTKIVFKKNRFSNSDCINIILRKKL